MFFNRKLFGVRPAFFVVVALVGILKFGGSEGWLPDL